MIDAASQAEAGWPQRVLSASRGLFQPVRSHAGRIAAYALVLGVFVPALKTIFSMSHGMVAGAPKMAVAVKVVAGGSMMLNPLSLLLLQVAVIIIVGRLCAMLLSRVGQPAVIGQVIGGLALGPSLLGALFPAAAAVLFPPASLMNLHYLSQIGLLAFMFIVGLQLDTGALKKQAGAAGLISHTSIVFPFLLGSALALALYTGFAPAGVAFVPFCLFMGIAMSITAFPVLASILHEKGMMHTPLGSLALACAAIDDVSGWGVLAVVVGVAHSGSAMAGAHVMGWALGYVAVMLAGVRPLLARMMARMDGPAGSVAAVVTLLLSALAAEMIGIHALFGAFLAGAIMPRANGLHERLVSGLSYFSTIVLLPIFFALTGLRTHLELLNNVWGVTAAVIGVALLGKLGGATAAARWSGMTWREALSIGALMNTRGLMELVVLNIGYDLGIISAPLFAILVLMAVGTTMMTGPLLSWLSRKPASVASQGAADGVVAPRIELIPESEQSF